MANPDEPLFDRGEPGDGADEPLSTLAERVRRLVFAQPFGVLCVQGEQQPYGALIAIAFTEDLKHAVFATPVTTRKYRLVSECDRVALVVDNRPSGQADMMEIEAVTVTGRASVVERGAELARWAGVLVDRHRYLESFVSAPTCALFRVDVVRYFHVVRFQEVFQWSPTDPS